MVGIVEVVSGVLAESPTHSKCSPNACSSSLQQSSREARGGQDPLKVSLAPPSAGLGPRQHSEGDSEK